MKRMMTVLTLCLPLAVVAGGEEENLPTVSVGQPAPDITLTGIDSNQFKLSEVTGQGKNVVLMRDMTDTMYNPRRWPFVSHERGTELVVMHVERFVCPTITSEQIIGGEPFALERVDGHAYVRESGGKVDGLITGAVRSGGSKYQDWAAHPRRRKGRGTCVEPRNRRGV